MTKKDNWYSNKELFEIFNKKLEDLSEDVKRIEKELRAYNHIKRDVEENNRCIRELVEELVALRAADEAVSDEVQLMQDGARVEQGKKRIGLDEKHIKIAIAMITANIVLGLVGVIL